MESLELRLKRIKDYSNFIDEFSQSFDYRRSIIERYTKGEIGIHVHFRFANATFCAVYVSGQTFKLADRAFLNNTLGNINYWCKKPVFIMVGEKGKTSKPVTAIVGLQTLYTCNVFDAESFQKGFPIRREAIYSLFDRKLRIFFFGAGVKEGQLVNEVIQSATQIVDNLSDKDSPSKRGIILDGAKSADAALSQLRIELESKTLFLMFDGGLNTDFQVRQVFTCPIYPSKRAIQRMHMLKYPQGETDAREETKNSQGVRDTRTQEKRFSKKPRKDSQTPTCSRHEEVKSQTSPVPRSGDCISKHTHSGRIEDA